ncbi:MAG TPA: UDP-2,3-diacylglucosamine diphosphatase [Syntrophorhabdaceae bacterium]|jgi:UDP-2,3-diacylglucosamine hydrolase
MKIVFFSDTHLDHTHGNKTKIVETFIREVCAQGDIIFILGDLFEFYHGYEGIYPWYQPVADALKDLKEKGITVYFLEGNHEFAMGSYFRSYTGVLSAESVSMEIDGKRLFVAHGDQFVGGLVRTVLKSPGTGRVMDLLGPRLTWAGAMIARRFLSKKKKPYNRKALGLFRQYAEKKWAQGFDAVVMAHTHIPDKVESGEGGHKKVYFNTGDFFAHSTYVSYETSVGFELKTHPYNTVDKKDSR